MKHKLLLCLLAALLLLSACSSNTGATFRPRDTADTTRDEAAETKKPQTVAEPFTGTWLCEYTISSEELLDALDPENSRYEEYRNYFATHELTDAYILNFRENGKIEFYSIYTDSYFDAFRALEPDSEWLEQSYVGSMNAGPCEISGNQCIFKFEMKTPDLCIHLELCQFDENTITATYTNSVGNEEQRIEGLSFHRISLNYPEKLLGTWTDEDGKELSLYANGDAKYYNMSLRWFAMDGNLYTVQNMKDMFTDMEEVLKEGYDYYMVYGFDYRVTGDRFVRSSFGGGFSEEFHR